VRDRKRERGAAGLPLAAAAAVVAATWAPHATAATAAVFEVSQVLASSSGLDANTVGPAVNPKP